MNEVDEKFNEMNKIDNNMNDTNSIHMSMNDINSVYMNMNAVHLILTNWIEYSIWTKTIQLHENNTKMKSIAFLTK